MKSTELRIGNLANDRGSIHWIIDAADIVALRQSEAANKINIDFNSILLTEEWLINLGFKKENNLFIYTQEDQYKSKLVIVYDQELILYKIAVQHFWYQAQTVHQMQNLFFSLTGEELTLE